MASSKIDIANMACQEVPCQRITSFDDGSLEADEINAAYGPSLDALLEVHDWDFAIQRGSLAEITNDRPDEWGHAYALPDGMSSPRFLRPATSATGSTVIAGLATVATPVFWHGNLESTIDEMLTLYPFTIADGKLYTDLESATLEYTAAPSESSFPALFARALAIEIASRIVMPLKQDSKRQDYLSGKAEIARQRAIADNMNRQPRQDFGFVSEDALSRDWGP